VSIPDLLANVGEWLATVELGPEGGVVVCEHSAHHLPEDLLRTCREHKEEIAVWLRWERAADALWRAVYRRLSSRSDLASDLHFQTLRAAAEAAHLRHDRPALVDALLDLEAYARTTRPDPEHQDQETVNRG